jgi:hypothetical protein
MRLFEQYSGRGMSNAGDVLFAFQGILSVLKRTLKTSFLAGLPEAYLHEGLLWLEIGPHTRRSIPVGNSTKMPYPSWTWAGWGTRASYDHIFVGFILPEVDWFIIDHSGVTVKLDAPGTYNPSVHPRLRSDNKDVRPGDPPPEFLRSVKPRQQLITSDGYWKNSQLLSSWTTIASFMLTGESFDLEDHGGTGLESRENVIIFDNAGNAAGSVLLERHCRAEMLEGSRTFEFILLSRSNTLADLMFFDAAVFPGREWCYINVMLIQRIGDTASRQAIGVVHEDAWIEAKPTPMLISLE